MSTTYQCVPSAQALLCICIYNIYLHIYLHIIYVYKCIYTYAYPPSYPPMCRVSCGMSVIYESCLLPMSHVSGTLILRPTRRIPAHTPTKISFTLINRSSSYQSHVSWISCHVSRHGPRVMSLDMVLVSSLWSSCHVSRHGPPACLS
jgi:hypothetical protein